MLKLQSGLFQIPGEIDIDGVAERVEQNVHNWNFPSGRHHGIEIEMIFGDVKKPSGHNPRRRTGDN